MSDDMQKRPSKSRKQPKTRRPYAVVAGVLTAFDIVVAAFATIVAYARGWPWIPVGIASIACLFLFSSLIMRSIKRKHKRTAEALQKETFEMPPDYNERRYWIDVGKPITLFTLIGAASLYGFIVAIRYHAQLSAHLDSAAQYVSGAALFIVLLCVFLICRSMKKWRMQPNRCEAADGVLRIGQSGKFFPWFIRDSDDDTILLDRTNLETTKSFWEWAFFHRSETLIYTSQDGKVKKVKHFKDVERVRDIQAYQRSLESQRVEQGKKQVDYLEEIANLLKDRGEG